MIAIAKEPTPAALEGSEHTLFALAEPLKASSPSGHTDFATQTLEVFANDTVEKELLSHDRQSSMDVAATMDE